MSKIKTNCLFLISNVNVLKVFTTYSAAHMLYGTCYSSLHPLLIFISIKQKHSENTPLIIENSKTKPSFRCIKLLNIKYVSKPSLSLTDSISLFKISLQILLLFNLMTQIIVPIGLWVSLTSFLTRKKPHKIIRICLRHVNVKWRIQNLQTISKLSKCWNSPSLNSHLKKISRNKKSEQCSYICF